MQSGPCLLLCKHCIALFGIPFVPGNVGVLESKGVPHNPCLKGWSSSRAAVWNVQTRGGGQSVGKQREHSVELPYLQPSQNWPCPSWTWGPRASSKNKSHCSGLNYTCQLLYDPTLSGQVNSYWVYDTCLSLRLRELWNSTTSGRRVWNVALPLQPFSSW